MEHLNQTLDNAVLNALAYSLSTTGCLDIQIAHMDDGIGWRMVDDVSINQALSTDTLDSRDILRVWVPTSINQSLRTVYLSQITGQPHPKVKQNYFLLHLHEFLGLCTQEGISQQTMISAIIGYLHASVPLQWPLKLVSAYQEEWVKPFTRYFGDNKLEWPNQITSCGWVNEHTLLLRMDFQGSLI